MILHSIRVDLPPRHQFFSDRIQLFSHNSSVISRQSNAFRLTFRQMDNNFAEFLMNGGWNTPTHFLERRLILSVVKVLCTRYTHSLHPHCTHKVENAKGKGCTCTRCTRGSGIPESAAPESQGRRFDSCQGPIVVFFATVPG